MDQPFFSGNSSSMGFHALWPLLQRFPMVVMWVSGKASHAPRRRLKRCPIAWLQKIRDMIYRVGPPSYKLVYKPH